MPTWEGNQQKLKAAAQRVERERDAAKAMQDYEAEKRAIYANMMRLRALRLAKKRSGV